MTRDSQEGIGELVRVDLGELLHLPKGYAERFGACAGEISNRLNAAIGFAQHENYDSALDYLFSADNLLGDNGIRGESFRSVNNVFPKLVEVVSRIFILRTKEELLPLLPEEYKARVSEILGGYAK